MIRSTLLLIFTIALLSISVSAQKNSYISTEGRFSLAVPAKPTETFVENSPGTAEGVIGFQWLLKDRPILVTASYADNLTLRKEDGYAKRDQMADLMVNNFTAQKFKNIVRRDIVLSGYPGFEISAMDPGSTLNNFGTTRMYVIGTRMVTVVAAYDAADKARAIQILNTLKIWEATPAKTPAKPRVAAPRS